MALSKKLNKPKVQENQIEELILKGGSSGTEVSTETEEVIKRMQLRLSNKKIQEIDKLVSQRIGNISRNTWIIEAIEEKLGKEMNQSEVNLTS